MPNYLLAGRIPPNCLHRGAKAESVQPIAYYREVIWNLYTYLSIWEVRRKLA